MKKREEIIDMIVKLNPFEVNCDGGGTTHKGNVHCADWFIALSCGCIHAVCEAGKAHTERTFSGLMMGNVPVCKKCHVEDVTVQLYQPVPAYGDKS